jgi:transposase InsO family protein
MNRQKQDGVSDDVALWRYGIISPLLHRDAQGLDMAEVLEGLCQRPWLKADGSHVTLSAETIRKWLYRYRQGGLPALAHQERSDKGRSTVPEPIMEALFELRKAHPRWTLARIFCELVQREIWNGRDPSRSALYRLAKAKNLQRDPHRHEPSRRRFAFEAFGEMWIADFLHGPKLREGRQRRKTFLHVIMDDCSRYVVWASFSLTETVQTLLTDLMGAVRRFGICQRFYTDNGACYASRYLKIVCARLGMQLIHTPPYRPQGRGKLERFFKTVRDQFLTGSLPLTLEELNLAFQTWLAETYHPRLHATLQCSPMQKRLAVRNACRPLPDVVEIEPLFRMERRCRVYGDGTIRLKKHTFEVPHARPGARVTVYFMPWDLSRVYYDDDFKPARPVDPYANARRFQHPSSSSENGGAP